MTEFKTQGPSPLKEQEKKRAERRARTQQKKQRVAPGIDDTTMILSQADGLAMSLASLVLKLLCVFQANCPC